jgi:hypothetical protein
LIGGRLDAKVIVPVAVILIVSELVGLALTRSIALRSVLGPLSLVLVTVYVVPQEDAENKVEEMTIFQRLGFR